MEYENIKNQDTNSDQPGELNEEELDEIVGGFDDWKKKWDGIVRLDNNPSSLVSTPTSQIANPVNIPTTKTLGQQF